jgi:hypothetical protein
MRFMSMVKAKESKFSPPPKALMEAIDQLLQDIAKEGCVMVQAGGLYRPARVSVLQTAR